MLKQIKDEIEVREEAAQDAKLEGKAYIKAFQDGKIRLKNNVPADLQEDQLLRMIRKRPYMEDPHSVEGLAELTGVSYEVLTLEEKLCAKTQFGLIAKCIEV